MLTAATLTSWVIVHAAGNIEVVGYKLILNGQDTHGIDYITRKYMKQRLLKQLHSNGGTAVNAAFEKLAHVGKVQCTIPAAEAATSGSDVTLDSGLDMSDLKGFTDKEIFAVPFSVDPENLNPSGHINFSKVSHATLRIKLKGVDTTKQYRVDVYAKGYNWVTYKGGRALLSFA